MTASVDLLECRKIIMLHLTIEVIYMANRLNTIMDIFRQDARIPLLIAAFLLLWIIINASQMINTLMDVDVNTPSATHSSSHSAPAPRASQWHLFGRYDSSLHAPQTRLPLVLQGIALASSGGHSRALIASSNGPTKVYQVGQSLSDGAIIHKILRDRVLLDDQGHLESLMLPIPKLHGLLTAATPST